MAARISCHCIECGHERIRLTMPNPVSTLPLQMNERRSSGRYWQLANRVPSDATLFLALLLFTLANPGQDYTEANGEGQSALPIENSRTVNDKTVKKSHNQVYHKDNRQHHCELDCILLHVHLMVPLCYWVEN